MVHDNKRGQIEVTFNWVYILIAGAVILLFFFGIVYKQKAVSEEQLGGDLVRIMQSIFTGAGVSEKTKNFIDIGGLAEYTLFFDCNDNIGEFGIKGTSARAENGVDPLFAPREIQATKLIVWSLPYKLPYKVVDFLFVTSTNTKYFLVGGQDKFVNEFMNVTDGFNREYVIDADYKKIDAGKNFQVRIVDFGGTIVGSGKYVPINLTLMDDDKVTAAVFTGSNVDYYQKKVDKWIKLNSQSILIISLGGEIERDAAKYGAIFAADDVVYKCNMNKAFNRLKYVNEIYSGKLEEMTTFYTGKTNKQEQECFLIIKGINNNLIGSLETQGNDVKGCLLDYTKCSSLADSANAIKGFNKNLGEDGDCITLY